MFGVLKQENTESIHDSRVPPSKPQKLDLSRMPVPPKAFGMIDVSVSGNGFTCNCASEIKGPDNPTSQLLPKMSFNGFSRDGEGRKDKGGGERSRR